MPEGDGASRRGRTWLARHPGLDLPQRVGRKCSHCGTGIDHRDVRSRHCSPRCRDRDWRGSSAGKAAQCEWCGDEFIKSKGIHRFCSPRCRSRSDVDRNREAYNSRGAARRARERSAGVVDAEFTRTEVFDRDGWICQLCLTPIDLFASGRHPLAPSIDHIVPLIKGGAHALDNVQCAHFSCNASKSGRYEGVNPILPPPVRHLKG